MKKALILNKRGMRVGFNQALMKDGCDRLALSSEMTRREPPFNFVFGPKGIVIQIDFVPLFSLRKTVDVRARVLDETFRKEKGLESLLNGRQQTQDISTRAYSPQIPLAIQAFSLAALECI